MRDSITGMTVKQLTAALDAGDLTSLQITEAYLDAIEHRDGEINAYITVTADAALDGAKQSDARRREGRTLSKLDGVPFAVKDNMCTADILTTCASHMLDNFVPPYTATAVQKLIDAGCVLLGKLNMDEFAMGSSTETSYFKKTRNPKDVTRVPGGSSGGSAAAVAANLAPFALGSDTGGSIRQPAAFCGVVGMKPTYGRVSRYGIVAFASSLDQVGPLTRNVEDSATVLRAIAGKDDMDASSLPYPVPDYTEAFGDVRGMKIGLPDEYFGAGIAGSTKAAVLKAADKLASMGAEIGRCSLPYTEYALSAYYIISSAEACSNLGRYDGIKYGHSAKGAKSIQEITTQSRSEGFGDEVKRRILLGTFALSSGYYDAYYKRAQQVRTRIMEDYATAFSRFDCLLTPVSPVTAWKFGEMSADPLEMYAADVCTVSINVAGLCALSLPCGTDENGLPIGAQLIGKPLAEETLYRVGHSLERQAQPQFPKEG